jgi:hypothetical protein
MSSFSFGISFYCQIVSNIAAKTEKIQHAIAKQWPAMHGVQIFSPYGFIPVQNLLSSGAPGAERSFLSRAAPSSAGTPDRTCAAFASVM